MSFIWPHFLWLLPLLGIWTYKNSTFLKRLESRWLLLAAVFVIIALARPVIEQEPIEIDQQGSDIIIAIDLSHSMLATDVTPTRLQAAKTLLHELVHSDVNDRFGVIGFTTNAIILSPLTSDSELLEHLFNGLDETLVMTKGTKVMPTLELARKMSKAKKPKVVLLTDGGDETSYAKEQTYIKENNLQVNVVMLASYFGSTLHADDGSLIKDDDGNIVVSSRNDAIKSLSDVNGGTFIEGADLAQLRDVLDTQAKEDYKSKTKVIQNFELFYGSVFLALVSYLLSVTVLAKKLRHLFFVVLVLFGVNVNAGILDGMYIHQAQRYYENHAYEEASETFNKVKGVEAQFNSANAAYKAGDYEKALNLYEGIRSSDPSFKSKVYFNMGNTLIRLQEFEKARVMFLNVLTLGYDKEADENLRHIVRAQEQEHLLTGQQKGKKRAQDVDQERDTRGGKKKKGGSSNMKVQANASSGGGEGKKTKNEGSFSLNSNSSKLSSKQYELINQRSVNETKPW